MSNTSLQKAFESAKKLMERREKYERSALDRFYLLRSLWNKEKSNSKNKTK